MTLRLALAALALAAALPASAGPPKARRHAPEARGHLLVKGEQDCAACHRTGTPEAFTAWEASPHGVALVKCIACHGSTGDDFRAKPDTARCGACHAAQVGSLARHAVRDCFACHAPHSLSSNPHRSTRAP